MNDTFSKLGSYCRRASNVLIADGTKHKLSLGMRLLVVPALPPTRDAATPHIVLTGPFEDDPELVAVGLYIGIGFIEVRRLKSGMQMHQLCTFEADDGDDGKARRDYLAAALHLYFNIKKIEAPAS